MKYCNIIIVSGTCFPLKDDRGAQMNRNNDFIEYKKKKFTTDYKTFLIILDYL